MVTSPHFSWQSGRMTWHSTVIARKRAVIAKTCSILQDRGSYCCLASSCFVYFEDFIWIMKSYGEELERKIGGFCKDATATANGSS